MGYTQYWNTTRSFTPTEWENIRSRTKKYLSEVDHLVAGPDGTGKPMLDFNSIDFNGVGDDSYESFNLRRVRYGYEDWMDRRQYELEGEFNFCKTALKPYDAAVIEVLKIARDCAPTAIKLSSDGGDGVFQ